MHRQSSCKMSLILSLRTMTLWFARSVKWNGLCSVCADIQILNSSVSMRCLKSDWFLHRVTPQTYSLNKVSGLITGIVAMLKIRKSLVYFDEGLKSKGTNNWEEEEAPLWHHWPHYLIRVTMTDHMEIKCLRTRCMHNNDENTIVHDRKDQLLEICCCTWSYWYYYAVHHNGCMPGCVYM